MLFHDSGNLEMYKVVFSFYLKSELQQKIYSKGFTNRIKRETTQLYCAMHNQWTE